MEKAIPNGGKMTPNWLALWEEMTRSLQFWMWVVGASLPCAGFLMLDYLWWAHPNRNAMRDDLLIIGDSILIVVSCVGLALMLFAVFCTAISRWRKVGLGLVSVVAVPGSLIAGLLGSFVTSGLPID